MPFENPFLEQYKKLGTAELLEIIEGREDYQLLAVEAAQIEINLRGLSPEELDIAKHEVEAKRNALIKQLERRQEKLDKAKSFGNFLYKTFYPVQFEEKKAETYVKYICFSLLVLTIVGLYKDLKLLYWPLGINHLHLEDLLILLPYCYISVAIVRFWKKKRSGWVLLFFYAIFSICMAASIAIDELRFDDSKLNGIFRLPPLSTYLFSILLYIALLLLLFRSGIREIYGIKLPGKAKDFEDAEEGV